MIESIFVATPAYGGLVTMEYVMSQMATTTHLSQNGVEFDWVFIGNESMVNRARNRCVSIFMKTNRSHMLFIDADIGWTTQNIDSLLACNVPVIGGTYPKKKIPIDMEISPLPEDVEFFPGPQKSPQDFKNWRAARVNENGLIQVRHIATGFLLIERAVFETLAPRVDSYMSPYANEIDYDYFSAAVREGGQPPAEDCAFSERCRAAGIPIHLNSRVVVSHTGTHVFVADVT